MKNKSKVKEISLEERHRKNSSEVKEQVPSLIAINEDEKGQHKGKSNEALTPRGWERV